jgi:hypothetical protein
MTCTWTIITNIRTITISGNGTPERVGGNARCVSIDPTFGLIKLSGEVDGYCSYANEFIVSSSSDCPPIDPAQPCDCVNGGCVPKTTYNTPGKYPSLAACQSGCAKDSACLGECVSPEQLAALQQAADLVKSKLCG